MRAGTPVNSLHAADFVLLDNGATTIGASRCRPCRPTLRCSSKRATPCPATSIVEQPAEDRGSCGPTTGCRIMTIYARPLRRSPALNRRSDGSRRAAFRPRTTRWRWPAPSRRSGSAPSRDRVTNAIDTMSLLDLDAVRRSRESSATSTSRSSTLRRNPDRPRSPTQEQPAASPAGAARASVLADTALLARATIGYSGLPLEDFDPLKDAAELTGGRCTCQASSRIRTAAAISRGLRGLSPGLHPSHATGRSERAGTHIGDGAVGASHDPRRRACAVDARLTRQRRRWPAAAIRPVNANASPAPSVLVDAWARDHAAARLRSARPPIARRSSATSAPAAIPGLVIPDEAVFAFELAQAGSRASRRCAMAARSARLTAKLVRQPFARRLSALALGRNRTLEGVLQPAHRRRRRERPGRFPRSHASCWRAVAADQRPSRRPVRPRAVTAPAIDVGEAYDAAIAHFRRRPPSAPPVAVLHRLGQNTSALPLLDAAPGDRPRHCAIPRAARDILMALGQYDAAIAAYRAARAIAPNAQSATSP